MDDLLLSLFVAPLAFHMALGVQSSGGVREWYTIATHVRLKVPTVLGLEGHSQLDAGCFMFSHPWCVLLALPVLSPVTTTAMPSSLHQSTTHINQVASAGVLCSVRLCGRVA